MKHIKGFFCQYREQILYIFFGVLTTLVSIGSFALFTQGFGWNALLANVLSWVLAVFTAFVTNRTWVFIDAKGRFLPQMLTFYLGRTATLATEELLLFLLVTCLGWHAMVVKLLAQVLILILNYIISKVFIFKHSR